MTTKPGYVVHTVREQDVTVDWFYGRGHLRVTLVQALLLLLGWFFTVLPVVVTASALLHRHDTEGWWWYPEGFALWDATVRCLGILLVVFVVGFLVLHLVDRAGARRRAQTRTYDEERLALRLAVAGDWYTGRFGPEALRHEQTRVVIEPYGDIGTYELRNLYRSQGVD